MAKTQTLFGAAVIILFIAAIIWGLASTPPTGDAKISGEVDQAIRSQVMSFGANLKNVALLNENAASQIEAEYGEFLSPALLAAWKENPSEALGRQTSSPWPDRIEVVEVVPTGSNQFRVEGNVIEITSADSPNAPAAVYPVTLMVAELNGAYRIMSVTKGAYSEIPQRVTVTGVWECLPHVPGAPPTEECGFGLKEDGTNNHYAIDTSLMARMFDGYSTGTHVRVEGVLVKKEMLSTNMWQKYDIVGIIAATMIEEI